MKWPWSRRGTAGIVEASNALDATIRAREAQRALWHPVLEVSEDMRVLRQRNGFAEKLRTSYALQGVSPSLQYNRRKDDPQ